MTQKKLTQAQRENIARLGYRCAGSPEIWFAPNGERVGTEENLVPYMRGANEYGGLIAMKSGEDHFVAFAQRCAKLWPYREAKRTGSKT